MSDEIIIFGVLASIVFHELTQISPGGIIVPGYIALLLDEPVRVAVTIGLSLLTWGAVRLLSEHIILFGRRRFAVFIIISSLLRYATGLITAEAHLPVTAAMADRRLVPAFCARDRPTRRGQDAFLMLLVAVALKLAFLAFLEAIGRHIMTELRPGFEKRDALLVAAAAMLIALTIWGSAISVEGPAPRLEEKLAGRQLAQRAMAAVSAEKRARPDDRQDGRRQ